MTKRDVVVLSAVRSAIGTFGGALSDIEPPELAGSVMKEAIKRSGIEPREINYVTVGTALRPTRALPTWRGSRPFRRAYQWIPS